MSTETNILLPTASVDIFIRDKETLEAARSLVDDWRFARVTISIVEGDVETAIQSYQEAQSPDLLIIETETTDDSFITQLETLSSHCSERTNAVVIGPVNDVNLYRSLTSMGVGDYLVRPVPLTTLSEVIATSLIAKLGISGSRLVAVVGSKGGVGTSSLSQGLAWGVSETMKQKTFLMDAAGGWSTLSVGMGFDPVSSLSEAVHAVDDEDTLARMIFKVNDKLSVLASGSDSMLDNPVQEDRYESLIESLMKGYPVVIVDLSAAPSLLKRTVLGIAHEIILVTTPTLSSLRAARTLMQEIKLLHGGHTSNVDLVVNMVGFASSKEVPKKDIINALDYTPSATIDFNSKLFVGGENEGRNLMESKEGTDVIARLLPLVQHILSSEKGEPTTKSVEGNIIAQILNKILKKG